MMFGLRTEFAYLDCEECHCVQIASYPDDLGPYYPKDYYAFQSQPPVVQKGLLKLKSLVRSHVLENRYTRALWLRRAATQAWLERETPLIRFYVDRFPSPSTRLLDVGCGIGALPHALRDWGFRFSDGVDPFIAADVVYNGRVSVWKRHLAEMPVGYDCISFHHSLEHMPDQAKVLTDARKLLAKSGTVIVRVPIVGTMAWKTYRELWVQLDAPRHFYLHSEQSLRELARQSGFVVESIEYDSTGLQFWGSELYKRDIALFDARSPARNSNSIFSKAELANFEREAQALNGQHDGDQVMAILRPA